MPFDEPDLIRLRDSLFAARGKVIVSLNDHPRVREIFSGWNFKTVTLKYSIARSTAAKSKDRAEVIIKNF
jgi:DNA adenine methylase